MPQNIAGFDYFEVEFNRKGEVNSDAQVATLADFIAKQNVTDLLVFAHGWNNDEAEARTLYSHWLTSARAVIDDPRKLVPGVANRRFAMMAVLWPSKRFAEQDLIPGGAAGLAGGTTTDKLAAQLEDMKKLFSEKDEKAALDHAKLLLPKIRKDANARSEFVERLRSLVSNKSADAEDGSDLLFKKSSEDLFACMSAPVKGAKGKIDPEAGGAASVGGAKKHTAADDGGAAGLGDWLNKVLEGAQNLADFTTYYEMKARAGLVGTHGVNAALQRLRKTQPALKLHLIGHSFGGRLVTSVIDGRDHATPLVFDSMTLLQAAFSHNGFAQNYHDGKNGYFRRVVTDKRVKGPVVVTFTKNDNAVGIAYPLASRMNNVDASAMGDANDRFGGIGRNGAQKTPEAVFATLLEVGGAYALKPGAINNLNADKFVHSHGDVASKPVAYATLTAISMT